MLATPAKRRDLAASCRCYTAAARPEPSGSRRPTSPRVRAPPRSGRGAAPAGNDEGGGGKGLPGASNRTFRRNWSGRPASGFPRGPCHADRDPGRIPVRASLARRSGASRRERRDDSSPAREDHPAAWKLDGAGGIGPGGVPLGAVRYVRVLVSLVSAGLSDDSRRRYAGSARSRASSAQGLREFLLRRVCTDGCRRDDDSFDGPARYRLVTCQVGGGRSLRPAPAGAAGCEGGQPGRAVCGQRGVCAVLLSCMPEVVLPRALEVRSSGFGGRRSALVPSRAPSNSVIDQRGEASTSQTPAPAKGHVHLLRQLLDVLRDGHRVLKLEIRPDRTKGGRRSGCSRWTCRVQRVRPSKTDREWKEPLQ